MRDGNKIKRKTKTYLLFWGALTLINLIFCIPRLANLYTNTIYLVISNYVGMITDRIPFLLGEILAYIAVVAVIIYVIILLVYLIKKMIVKRGLKEAEVGTKLRTVVKRYGCALLSLIMVVAAIYTFAWSIPYHNTNLGINPGAYTFDELQDLRNEIARSLNDICEKVDRDENGHVIFDGTEEAETLVALQKLGNQFPNLEKYYPKMKSAICSPVLDWMNIGGVTIPYTMEILGNRYVSKIVFPSLYAHELTHHLGYYKESEASFLGAISCINSEKLTVQYSGYFSAYWYINDAYKEKLSTMTEEEKARYKKVVPLNEQVLNDYRYSINEAEEYYKATVNPSIEVFKESSEAIADKGWETQADILQEDNYDGCVGLLLEYYVGNGNKLNN